MARSRSIVSVCIGLLLVGGAAVMAADPLEVAKPEMYKLLFENERVRVMELNFNAGEAIAEHSHPDHFVYILEPGALDITTPDGQTTKAEAHTGDVLWMNAQTHSAVNSGTTHVRAIVVELKG